MVTRNLVALALFLAALGWVVTGWPSTDPAVAFPAFIALTVAGCMIGGDERER